MKIEPIHYLHTPSSKVEVVLYQNAHLSYPKHIHIGNYVMGLVLEGQIELHLERVKRAFVPMKALF